MMTIRSHLFNVLFILWTALVAIGCSPLLINRKSAIFAQNLWGKGGSLMIKYVLNIDYEVRGLEHLPGGAVVVAAKHQSTWDTIVLHDFIKDPAWVLKKELHSIPFLGWFYQRTGSIPVDRKGGSTAMRYMLRRADAAKAANRPIIIFPEGTRKAVDDAPDYQPGVAGLYRHLKLPVVPMALNSGCFWGRREAVKRPGTIVVEFLPAIQPGLDRRAFLAQLQNAIEDKTRELVRESGRSPAGRE